MSVKNYLPDWLKFAIRVVLHLCGRYRRGSYSQEGEDILLARFIDENRPGFYVDVGAHHPSRFSNTFYFYKRGWRGINIDAMPGSMRLFRVARPRDVNLEIAVSDSAKSLEFHTFNEPLLNSAHKQIAASRRLALDEVSNEHNVVQVVADTLEFILDRHLPRNTEIDFMSVDVEGLDLDVLRSNNWTKFRPKYVLVEVLGHSISTIESSDVYKFLATVGYEPMSKLVHTSVFRDRRLGELEYI